MAFWDPTHGIVLGDPVPDETGTPKFQLLMTTDGQSWTPIPPSQLPPAIEGEGAFAASNTCLAILSNNDPNIWFATGGRAARVFHSPDRGRTWQVSATPITHGPDSAGIFSIAFRDANHGVIAGGDYKHPDQDGPNLAFTNDGGLTWTVSPIHPQAYFSAVAYDRQSITLSFRPEHSVAESNAMRSGGTCCSESSPLPSRLNENQTHARLFIVAPKFIFDFRPPQDPTRISPRKKSATQFNAVSPYPTGGALFVGPHGSIVTIP